MHPLKRYPLELGRLLPVTVPRFDHSRWSTLRRATTTLVLAFTGALFVMGAGSQQASAIPIANESFVYPAGPLVPGNNGGSGFTGAWAGDPGVAVQLPGLMHPLALGSSGLMIGGGFNANRSLSAAISQNIFWASFLIRADPGNDQVWLGFDVAATPLPMITFGRRLDSYFIQNAGNPPATLPGASPSGVTDLLIARVTRGGAGTRVDLWINKRPLGAPDLTQVFGPVPPPSVVNTQVQPGLFADEIHIGTDPTDVALGGVLPSLDPADIDWSTIPGGAVRFHLRFRNNDPANTSDPISGDMQSQSFGVFQPDFGPIGTFNVPSIPPNSFFDVFFDVPLSQLPAPPEKLTPNSLTAGGGSMPAAHESNAALAACPPDDHWDGNVDIHWSGPTGGGTVTKHIASMQVCPGGGRSNIHTLVFCGAPSTWTITGLCPGWTATLVNESPPLVPDGPAPNPVPAGWTGFIQVSAGAVVPPGATCPLKVTFDCGGVPGVIDLNPVACECQPVPPPGTPLGGNNFVINIVEPVESPAGGEPVFGPFALPSPVQSGFVVLLEQAGVPQNDPSQWSDVVDFKTHQAAQQAFLVSDPSEQGITDADLAPLGLSIAQVLNGNTVFVVEQSPVTLYQGTNPTTGLTGSYNIISDNSGNLGVENGGGVSFGIRSATPNPSRGSLRVEYGLSRAASVRVEVYDVAGKLVRTLRDGASKAGVGSVSWDGLNRSGERVSAGTYFIMLRSQGQSAVHRVVMLH